MEEMEKGFGDILRNDEVLGLTRVPLYLMDCGCGNKFRGFPTFLNNQFAGNAVEQLMKACITEGILTVDQVRVAYHLAAMQR